ncbi:peroxiredoxin-like family protein [Tamlana sp. 2_MG-2023]|uniref:AhpC/TSA family protein n=1 Tax=Pseudotamlana agarivorans TaxID=481183 RepID=A0ACC5U520_9FLAO|nr:MULTISPECIES: peroxiredoxin-like family protein [Tamlana]MBU2949366.1 AhpC/TSA family protein [Tamlana agarivorans]MDO6760378.1 peroxiredoxin-like family protein [Tamlana sp. 2_MG-2023]MDO6789924.1 peroxiredoxin-like family protein [Tamlana sp. 1_MG-2023]
MILPNTEVPALSLPLTDGSTWDLKSQKSEAFTILVFYRGLHCPVCKKQLQEIEEILPKFKDRGVDIISISCDTEKRANLSAEKWEISKLPIAYNLSIEEARKWGLYVSEAISDKEPEQFSEPGIFIIRPDFSLYASSIQTMPFARPQMEDILKALDFVTENDYPARGSK